MSVTKTQKVTTRTTGARIECDYRGSNDALVLDGRGGVRDGGHRFSVMKGDRHQLYLVFDADTLRDAAELFNQLADELDRSDG